MRFTLVIACEGPLPPTGDVPGWLSAARAAASEACRSAGPASAVALVLVGQAPGDTDATPAVAVCDGVTEQRLVVPEGTLVPRRWSVGLATATGEGVGLLIDRCVVPPGWVVAAIAGLRAGYVGVGGGFRLAADHTRLDAAVYHLRYGAFPPGRAALEATSGELAGDNAAYDMAALAAHRAEWAEGFWEVTLHRRWRAEGRSLARSRLMDVSFAGSHGALAFAAQRYRHGQHAGRWRVVSGQAGRARILLCSPAVPAVLLVRAWRRAGEMDKGRLGLLGAAPEFLLLAAGWAAGEAVAAVRRESND